MQYNYNDLRLKMDSFIDVKTDNRAVTKINGQTFDMDDVDTIIQAFIDYLAESK